MEDVALEFAGTFCVVAGEVIRRMKRLERNEQIPRAIGQQKKEAKTTVMENRQ